VTVSNALEDEEKRVKVVVTGKIREQFTSHWW